MNTLFWVLAWSLFGFGEPAQDDLEFLIGQSTPSAIAFGVDIRNQKGYILDGQTRLTTFKVNLKNSALARQVDDFLWLWDFQKFSGITCYDRQGSLRQIALDLPASPAMVEPFGDHLGVLWFDANFVHMELYDKHGTQLSAEIIESKARRMLNMGKPMHLLRTGETRWIWSPRHQQIWTVTPQAKLVETLAIKSSALAAYDPKRATAYATLEEKGDQEALKTFLANNAGLIVKATPAGMVPHHGEPLLVTNITLLGEHIREDGKAYWYRETVLEDLQGKQIKKIKDAHFRGIYQNQLLLNHALPGQPPKMILVAFP